VLTDLANVRFSRLNIVPGVVSTALCLLLAACGGGGSPGDPPATPQTYSLSATVSGLNSAGLVLMANATAVTVAEGATTQPLATGLTSGTSYSVTVATQPTGETCTVAGGSGAIQSANVANVVVTCSDQAYSLGGSISGLNGSGLVLANGSDTFAVSSGATSFTMPTPVAYTSSYAVAVRTQPAGLACAVSTGTGTMPARAVTNVTVSCTDQPFTLGGTITGLGNNTGLVLVNGGDTLTVRGRQNRLYDAHPGCLRQRLLRHGRDWPGGPYLHGEQRLRHDAGEQRHQHRHRLFGSILYGGRHDQRAHRERPGAGQWQRYAQRELGCVELHDAHPRRLHQRLRRDGADATDGAHLLGEQWHGHSWARQPSPTSQ
jgi:hypothetical protein